MDDMYATWERIESSSHDHTGNMIDRNSVDSIDDAWPGRQLLIFMKLIFL
jgi:hypothetical protein